MSLKTNTVGYEKKRYKIKLYSIVQGVWFRPFVYN